MWTVKINGEVVALEYTYNVDVMVDVMSWEYTRMAEEILEMGLEDRPEPLMMHNIGKSIASAGVDLQMLVNEALCFIFIKASMPVEEAYWLCNGEDD